MITLTRVRLSKENEAVRLELLPHAHVGCPQAAFCLAEEGSSDVCAAEPTLDVVDWHTKARLYRGVSSGCTRNSGGSLRIVSKVETVELD